MAELVHDEIVSQTVKPDRISFKTNYIQFGDNVISAINSMFSSSGLQITVSPSLSVYIQYHQLSNVQISLPDPVNNVSYFMARIGDTGIYYVKSKLGHLLEEGGNCLLFEYI